MKRYLIGVLLLIAIIALAGCAPSASADDPQAGEASVDSIDIMILESFPVQVRVIARGTLPDGCTTIDTVNTELESNTFTVTITTARSADTRCSKKDVPFEEGISLPVVGLKAGTYTVNVNGTEDTFTLTVDNILPTEPPTAPTDSETPAGRPTTDDLPRQPEPKPVTDLADVESIEVQQPSNPNVVPIVVRGYLRDGCTKIDEINTAQVGDRFIISITTVRPEDAMCTQAIVSFEEVIELDVEGVPAGDYVLEVNDQRASLHLPLGE